MYGGHYLHDRVGKRLAVVRNEFQRLLAADFPHADFGLGRLTAAEFAFGVPILLKRGLLRPGDSRSGRLMPRRFRLFAVLPPARQRSRET
jgi:hypothetical protein